MTRFPPHIIQLLEKTFDRILVLTVPRFRERQERVRERLEGIPFEFFYGVDKIELTEKFILDNYHHDKRKTVTVNLYSKPLNNGEIACALSHRNIYQAMIDNHWKRVLIFEDDVVPPEGKKISILENILNEINPSWELLYLGYLKNEAPDHFTRLKHSWYRLQSSVGFSKLPYDMVKNLLPSPASANLMRAGYHDCTHAYALTTSAAQKLLQLQTPLQYRADNAISYLVLNKAIQAFAASPSLFSQEVFLDKSSKSYIR